MSGWWAAFQTMKKTTSKIALLFTKSDFIGQRRKATNCKKNLPVHAKGMKVGRFTVQDHQNKPLLVPSDFCNFCEFYVKLYKICQNNLKKKFTDQDPFKIKAWILAQQ